MNARLLEFFQHSSVDDVYVIDFLKQAFTI